MDGVCLFGHTADRQCLYFAQDYRRKAWASSVTTILAVLAGGEFFGIIGMLVAVPVTAILKVILKRLVEAIV